MKKLILLVPFFLLFSGRMAAQEKSQKQSIVISAGPNCMLPLIHKKEPEVGNFSPEAGFSFGVDFFQALNQHLMLKLGARYNTWKGAYCRSFFFETDYQNGPPYTPTEYCLKTPINGWQYLLGVRWNSAPNKWRWISDVELGISGQTPNTSKLDNPWQAIIGAGFGVERRVGAHLFLYAQPGSRFAFQKKQEGNVIGYRFFTIQMETGVRYAF